MKLLEIIIKIVAPLYLIYLIWGAVYMTYKRFRWACY